MSDEATEGGAAVPPDLDPGPPAVGPGRNTRKRRGPTPAELVLLRWLAAKPRPVTMGPVGNCVKRGWCEPVPAVVEGEGGRRPGFIYVVTEAGARLIGQHSPASGLDGEASAAGEAQAGREGAEG